MKCPGRQPVNTGKSHFKSRVTAAATQHDLSSRQMVEPVRGGLAPGAPSRQFGPTAWTIALWAKPDGQGPRRTTTAEREELTWLRGENREPRKEREILGRSHLLCRDTIAWRTGSLPGPSSPASEPGDTETSKRPVRWSKSSSPTEPVCAVTTGRRGA